MTSPLTPIRQWYAALEARKLAALTPELREEVLAFDASMRRHKWRMLAASFAIWMAAAAAFRFGVNDTGWVEALVLSFLLLAATGFSLLSVWFGHYKFRLNTRMVLKVVGLSVAGALVGGMIGRLSRRGTLDGMFDGLGSVGSRVFIAGLIVGAIYGLLILVVVQMRRRLLQARHAALQRQAEADRTARQLADARLKLMQAQVEPHFLFNTLGTVQDLTEGKAPEAAALTRELITFLRAGLAGLRTETTTLGREFEMAAAFLAIMKTRMGDRLAFSLELPQALAGEPVPPAMLISLVENAIKHGLEPALDGGSLRLGAQ
uniref:sensor histidine kinase n=1 Tax=Casimicrobium huifangae TaxID=2591109 RepID=UPI003782EB62